MKKILLLASVFSMVSLGSLTAEAKLYASESDMIDDLRSEIYALNVAEDKKIKDEEYEIITYEDIMREREGKVDVRHTFYAEVQQYEELPDQNMAYALLMRDGDLDRAYYVWFPKVPKQRLMKGDIVDVYGNLKGLVTYETVMGGSKTVPLMFAEKILVQGIDY